VPLLSPQRTADAAPILVVAVTGRALAESAARAGRSVVVLDYFADRDTRAIAEVCRAVARPGTLRFDRRALGAAAAELAPPERCSGVVYGSGFEGHPELLTRLAVGRRLLGNSPAILTAVREPRRFFSTLDALTIPHPEVSFTTPPEPTGWLVKHPGGAGGTRVRPAGRRPPRSGSYFQRLVSGRSVSVLFLADGRHACLIGFNEQWTTPRPGRPFRYGGAVGAVTVSSGVRSTIQDRLNDLVAASGLIGLNGLDFLLDGDRWSVLEVNPRPTATVELYDPDYPEGLFAAHLEACSGRLPLAQAAPGASRAHAIVHAEVAWETPESFEFPAWCHDIPIPGTRVAPGDPICTVRLEAETPANAATLARARAVELRTAVADAIRTRVGT
jgi:uncharacterized protein